MFWDASYTPSPKIEALLNKENVTLTELLDDEEIISECKSQNSKLVQFLNRTDVLEELITLITTVPPPNAVETLRFKHSNIACEILTSDLQSINRSIVSEEKVLQRLYAFLEQEAPLNPLLLSFFSKVFGMLWTQKQKQDWFTYQFVCVTVLEFLKSRGNFMDSVLRHVYSPVMLDLVYHMVTNIEGPDIRKTLYEWLVEQNLVAKLIGVLGETGEDAADKHLNVAQFVVEYLAMGRTKRQSEKQEGVTNDPILDLLEDKSTLKLLLEKIVTGDPSSTSSSAIVAGTRIILALFDDNLIVDNTDDPALQYLVNSEKEHYANMVADLETVIVEYVDKFHDLLLIEPLPIVSTVTLDSGISNETVASTPEKELEDTPAEGEAVEETKVAVEEEKEAEKEKEEDNSSASEASTSSTERPPALVDGEKDANQTAEAANETVTVEAAAEAEPKEAPRRNNFSRSPAFGNTRLQICCLFTVLLETENSDIINAICASNFFKTLLNLFKQYCWNNFLHSQAKKCLSYAIGAFDEVRTEASNEVQLEVSKLQRHLIVDCDLASVLIECWQANEVEQVERNGVRLGYMGHLIGILDVLMTNCKASEKLRALVEETLRKDEEKGGDAGEGSLEALWTKLTGEKGQLDTELGNQKRFLADCNPSKMNDCEPKDFFIEATDTFQDLESTALSENLDNFLSRYISSDLNAHFFNTVNGWSEDNLDEFEGLADKNWSKFDGDGGESSGNPLNFANPWDNDEDANQAPDEPEEKLGGGSGAVPGTAASSSDSGWANFSSANFADFDTHFNEFAIGTFDGTEALNASSGSGPMSSAATATTNSTFDKIDESLDTGAEGDVKNSSLPEEVVEPTTATDSISNANTKNPEIQGEEKATTEEIQETEKTPIGAVSVGGGEAEAEESQSQSQSNPESEGETLANKMQSVSLMSPGESDCGGDAASANVEDCKSET